jgi:Helicase associated domain
MIMYQFKALHGHCNVPARYNENRKLGIFVSAQRSQYKALQMLEHDQSADKTRTSLTPERIRLLNDLGFSWTVRSQYLIGESWNQKLNELKLYRDIHGHCNVPARYPENPGLGIWVRRGWQCCQNVKNVLHVSHILEHGLGRDATNSISSIHERYGKGAEPSRGLVNDRRAHSET